MAITAREVIERLRTKLGSQAIGGAGIDKITAGNMDMEVKGIAATIIVTLDVAKRAIDKGLNMVISHESTFFNHRDNTAQLQDDETYKFKRDFFEKNKMIVLHLHDGLHMGSPDGILKGLIKEMGWESNLNPQGRNAFTFPSIPLAEFAQSIAKKLDIHTMRIEGDPKMLVNHVVTSLGNAGSDACARAIARDDVDVFIFGETDEWEAAGYVLDAIKAGKKKALIYVGHMESEQMGMKYLAEQMKEYVTEVPVEYITLPELFWRTDNPVWEFKKI